MAAESVNTPNFPFKSDPKGCVIFGIPLFIIYKFIERFIYDKMSTDILSAPIRGERSEPSDANRAHPPEAIMTACGHDKMSTDIINPMEKLFV